VKVPDTPAGQKFAAWLEVFNRGDRAAYQEFLEKHYPSHHQPADQAMAFREMTGGFDLKNLEPSTPDTQVALLQERNSDQFARLTLAVDSAEPHKIVSLGLMAIPRPAEFPLPHLRESDLVASVRTQLVRDAAAGRFAGTVLIAKHGTPVLAEAYGLSDREQRTPNTLQTRFRIGSMNKMFTATATLQLVQAGKLGLNDPLGKYLTDYPNQDLATKVTVYHLLTHTGGTGDIFGPEFSAHRLELRTLNDYVKLYGTRALRFEPGSKWEYSNYGFILLGVIIEKVSGQSYYDYVRDHAYNPAGMTSSGSEPEDQAVPDRSVGYTRMGGGAEHPNTETLPYRGTSAGGGYSTVEDLVKFANALEGHQLLDAEHAEMLTTGKVDTPGGGRYAFGFDDHTTNGIRCFGHGGGAPGMNGELEICPTAGYVVAVLANLDPPAAGRIAQFITNRLPEK
jgi:CubicO group peptidase (beta-lactamase class C family)